ncbi:MAG: nucleoside hydrolase [Gemmatimonadetes bacterium]|nr:nucleoside hydrolase [Gemmatimonadota bacterium]MYG86104.1 nucleoside hydrolase [Gemmatimonadota bacterium]MYJ90396.1 nucleoside hydrolase [Gemmatimonadota bacterium]
MPVRVILDTDTGVDDALAILLAMRSPELRVEAITGVCGNTSLENCVRNIHLTLSVLDARETPVVARGEERPLVRELAFAGDIHGEDGLGGVSRQVDADGRRVYPDPDQRPSTEHAVDLITNLAGRYPGELILVAVGPLTNVARAVMKDPDRMRGLRAIIIMGGAFETGGNVSPVAEFNIHADPHAAQIVCDSGIPLVFVPLDVTRQAFLDAGTIDRFAAEAGARAVFVRDCTARYVAFHRQNRGVNGCFLHDPLAVAVAVREDLVTTVPARVDVETAGDLTTGMTVSDLRSDRWGEPNARVCTAVDVQAFTRLFEERVLA